MSQSSDDKAIIVFDGSGSMWGQIAGKSKIEIARETLGRVVGSLSADLQLGLIAYGHNRKGDCTDIETLVEVGPASQTGQQIAQSIKKVSPKGKTPLSEAVKRAAQTLRYTEDKATVILVTDGIETCNADPCALGNQLEQEGINFTAHVVGFGLSKDEGTQVACLAENTGGLYLAANNADQLADALSQTVAVAPPKSEPELQERPENNFLGRLALVQGAEPLPLEATKGTVRWFTQTLDSQQNLGKKVLIDRDHEAQWFGEPGSYLLSIEFPSGGLFSQNIALSEFDVSDKTYALNAARMSG
ncbi:MAG: VWA domain-containing protein, partial [Pseudomonadota bacterium]